MRSGAAGTAFSRSGIAHGTEVLSPAFLHQFTVGIAYAFEHPAPASAPAPQPPAAPAPAAARTYLVFFD